MALVYRNGRPRLQRSVRRDGRVTTEYRASGEVAVAIARLEAYDAEDKDLERRSFQAKRDAVEAVEGNLEDYFNRVEDLARSALYAAGFHRPKREWRRRRERREDRGDTA